MCAAPGARTGGTAALQAGRKQERGGEARGAGGAGAEGLPGRAGKGREREFREPPVPRAGGGGLRSVCACVPARRPRPSPAALRGGLALGYLR